MHGSGPKLLIIAKKEMIGDDGPDFGGESFLEAKKKMVANGGDYPDDDMMAVKEIAKQLYKSVDMHKQQADRLMAMCGAERDEEDDGGDKDDDYKSYGDIS